MLFQINSIGLRSGEYGGRKTRMISNSSAVLLTKPAQMRFGVIPDENNALLRVLFSDFIQKTGDIFLFMGFFRTIDTLSGLTD